MPRRETITAAEVAAILHGSAWDDPDADPVELEFTSGADVCEALAEAFAFTNADYRRFHEEHTRRHCRECWAEMPDAGTGPGAFVRCEQCAAEGVG